MLDAAKKPTTQTEGPEQLPSSPKGGVYVLRSRETGAVVRFGRTNDLESRRKELQRNTALREFKFEVQHETDDYEEQRGLEQELDWIFAPPLSKIRPIDVRRRDELRRYLKATNDY